MEIKKLEGSPSSYGGCSRADDDGAGVLIPINVTTHINNNRNINKVGRHLMHLEMFVARESNNRDDTIDNMKNTISRIDINLTTFKISQEASQEKLDNYLGD